jgi:hypothetical protein
MDRRMSGGPSAPARRYPAAAPRRPDGRRGLPPEAGRMPGNERRARTP